MAELRENYLCYLLHEWMPCKEQFYEADDLTILTQKEGSDFPLEIHKELASYTNWLIGTVKRELEGRMDEEHVGAIDTVKVLNFGLKTAEECFSYEANVTIKDLVKSAGPNKIVSIGSLIGGQVEVD